MPPTRRRLTPTPATPAVRRPKVAGGLRRPSSEPEAVEPQVVDPEPVFQEAPVAGSAVIGADTEPEPAKAEVVEGPVAEEEGPRSVVEQRAGAAPRKGLPPLALPVALLVVAVVLGGLGFWFFREARGVQTSTAAANQALVDSARTSEVNGQVQDAIEKAFSYNFSDVEATHKVAGEVLSGKAKCQYDVVFEPVRKLAPEQKLVVTTKAVSSGVTVLDGNRATALVFVDQVATRTTDNQTGGGMGMLRATAERVDDHWRLTDLFMFGQTAEQQKQMEQCK